MEPYHIESGIGGPDADPGSPGAQLELADHGLTFGSQSHKNQTDLIAPVILVGSGYTGNCHGKVGTQSLSGTLGHGLGHRRGNSTVFIQKVLRDMEQIGFYGVYITHNTAVENGGGTGQVSDTLGDEAAGAAFGGG